MMTSSLKPRPGIMDVAIYVGGEAKVAGVEHVRKLSANESPLGASPRAIAAYRDGALELHRYPEDGALALRQAISHKYHLDFARIICGFGSDDVLHMLMRAYVGPGDEVIHTRHAFATYRIFALACGATPVMVDEKALTADVDFILQAVTPRTRAVFLANPNNPTGTYIADGEVKRLRAGLPDDVLLVLDAAYADYVVKDDYSAGFELVDQPQQNTVVTRTFSKIFGLAALRLGWAYLPPAVNDVVSRVRLPFNVASAAIAAGIAALADEEHLAQAIAHNNQWLSYLSDEITNLGLAVTPSVGNFLLIHFPLGVPQVDAADQYLKSQGLILRRMGGYHLPNALRLTVGLEEDNRAVVKALREFLR